MKEAMEAKHEDEEDLRIAIVSAILMAAVASGGAAANAVDESDDSEDTGVENGEMAPLLADVGQNSALAGLAVVAQNVLLVAPGGAVGVRHCWPCFWDRPECRVLELEPAVGRWLAATRLQTNYSNWFREDEDWLWKAHCIIFRYDGTRKNKRVKRRLGFKKNIFLKQCYWFFKIKLKNTYFTSEFLSFIYSPLLKVFSKLKSYFEK